MTPNSIINLAIREARKSPCRFRMGAVIWNKSFIASSGHNNPFKTHPKSNVPWKTVHAEFAAILGVEPHHLAGASIYIHRLKRNGSPGLAKPCSYCQMLLDAVGIINVEYSK